jgi:hypothetical protein
MRIRDPGWKKSDPGSGINIPDPQHWLNCYGYLHKRADFMRNGYLCKGVPVFLVFIIYVVLNDRLKFILKLNGVFS